MALVTVRAAILAVALAAARRMEPDMVLLLKSSSHHFMRSKAVAAALLLLAYWAFFLPGVQQARAEEKEQVLPESGIHYPGGFDPNTVGQVEGEVSGYTEPSRGPVRFQVISGRETYTVLVCPPWYWKDLGPEIADGSKVRVQGSKSLGKDGKLYIIAQEIRTLATGHFSVFRNEDGFPLWKGSRRKTMGTHRGFGSSKRGIGGTSGGTGGMHRGRR